MSTLRQRSLNSCYYQECYKIVPLVTVPLVSQVSQNSSSTLITNFITINSNTKMNKNLLQIELSNQSINQSNNQSINQDLSSVSSSRR